MKLIFPLEENIIQEKSDYEGKKSHFPVCSFFSFGLPFSFSHKCIDLSPMFGFLFWIWEFRCCLSNTLSKPFLVWLLHVKKEVDLRFLLQTHSHNDRYVSHFHLFGEPVGNKYTEPWTPAYILWLCNLTSRMLF